MNFSLNYGGRLLLFVALVATGTTILGSSSITNQAWADVFEGTEGRDVIVGTPGADLIDSKGDTDENIGDTRRGQGSGNDVIFSGEGDDDTYGDTRRGQGSGNDIIVTEQGDDQSTGNGGADIFVCGDGDDTVTDFNEEE
jgi:Ca2+-binding RTX toxin-like protein